MIIENLLMKIILTLFLFFCVTSFAQVESQTNRDGIVLDAGMQVTSRLNFRNLGLSSSIYYSSSWKKVQLEIGPDFYFFDNLFGPKIGLGCNFKYYLNDYNNRFSTYLISGVNLIYFREKEVPLSRLTNLSSISKDPEDFTWTYARWKIGFGVNFKISDKFYIGSHFLGGIGYGVMGWDDAPQIPITHQFYFDLNLSSNINLGIRF